MKGARDFIQHLSPPVEVVPRVARLVSLLGCALTIQATPAVAQARRPVPPSQAPAPTAPPWSEANGASPLPFVRARVTYAPLSHPAVHGTKGGRGRSPRPLFPRLNAQQEERRLREEAMSRHPAGKRVSDAAGNNPCGDRHLVRRGDNLWDIASTHAESSDPSSIRRYVRRLHRLNEATIGSDPNLILPGQLLKLPEQCD